MPATDAPAAPRGIREWEVDQMNPRTLRRTGSAKRAMAVWSSALVLVATATVLVGPAASAGAGTISVTCADWFYTNRNQVHVVLHVKDGAGNPVSGAQVTVENSVDGKVYTTRTSTTVFKYNFSGMNHASSCGSTASPTTTGALCCTLGKLCPEGFFTTTVLDVVPPAGSGLVWDGLTPPNGRLLVKGGS